LLYPPRIKSISVVLLTIFTNMVLVVGMANSFYNPALVIAQENNSNISSGLQMDNNITNMTISDENLTDSSLQNTTGVKNITEISNVTAGEAISLQKIVTLKRSAPDSAFNDLVNEVKSKGAEIIHTYKELLNAFAFRAPNDQVLTEIVTDLKNNTFVESVTPDKSVGIMNPE
jgi:Peptidase inhibitor I9